MIHLITKGGMGNQMFQYAFALQVKKVNGDKRIWLNGFYHPFSKDKRKPSLYHFCLTEHARNCSLLRACYLMGRFAFTLMRTLGLKGIKSFIKARKRTQVQYEKQLCQADIYLIDSAWNVPPIEKSAALKHLFSYFQSPNIVAGIEEEVRAAFTVKTPASQANQEMLRQIQSHNAVCMHVRRGDYSKHPQFQICNEAYYREAVKQALETLENPVFFVFSTGHEDVEWVRQHYRFDADLRFVDLDNPDYEELRLMMACKHFIISNSTFSWWAAVLSAAAGSEKVVWAPTVWLKGSQLKMTLDSWRLIEA
ncbi:MAG: alpha-1,2-fucosyltransferase [Akkermansia sp.]|nr:alpha-1,2-fucosyltransferase [Akkermansia sp.]